MNRHCKACIGAACAVAMLMILSPVFAGDSLGTLAERALNCGVSADAVDMVRDMALGDRIDEATAVSLLTPLLAACVEQLPGSPLEDKLSEGVTKRVPPPLIVGALNKRLEGYRFARELLLTTTGSLDPTGLAAIGEGVGKNVPRSDFESYAATFGKEPIQVFLTGLEMVSLQGQAGFPYELTSRILEKGVQSGSLTVDWHHFIRVIATARKRGIGDEAIANAAIAVLERDGSVSDVLPELGFTGRDLGGDKPAQ